MDQQKDELTAAIKALAVNQTKPQPEGIVTHKNVNVLVLGVIAAVGALVWNTTVSTPANFSMLAQQNNELRSTLNEMKDSLGNLDEKFDDLQKTSGDQHARLTTLENTSVVNRENINKINDRLNALERSR